jgi:hypothetical protein
MRPTTTRPSLVPATFAPYSSVKSRVESGHPLSLTEFITELERIAPRFAWTVTDGRLRGRPFLLEGLECPLCPIGAVLYARTGKAIAAHALSMRDGASVLRRSFDADAVVAAADNGSPYAPVFFPGLRESLLSAVCIEAA